VIGTISLASAMAPMDGHVDVNQALPANPPVGSVPPPVVPPPPSSDPFPRQGQ
jgi:hypothetical protein